MTAEPRPLPVSIYCVWQWWEKHYQHHHGRPRSIDYDWLDRHYLGRQRFLFEHFGRFGIGQEHPTLDKKFVATLLPFHTIIVPVLLGVHTAIQEVGGYCWQNMPEADIRKLKPIDLAASPVGELLLRERESRLARYGVATQMIDLASPTNNAFTLRGPDFYADLVVDEDFARHTLDVITETMCLAHKFITDLFGPADGFPTLANCNVTMISPQMYEKMILEYDIRCVEFAAKLTGKSPRCDVHHCNVKTEPFATVYGKLPGLRSLQGACVSDIRAITQTLPNVSFSAMVNPADLLTRTVDQIDCEIDAALAAGAADLAIWDIDPAYGPQEMKSFFHRIETLAQRHHRRPVFSVTPFTWEELDWEFPNYRNI